MQQALDGLKVADFTWAVVGPLTTKYLSDCGATVVKVESVRRPDPLRLGAPYKDGIPGVNRSGLYSSWNTNKYSLALDLGHQRGREVARRLVAWADVVAENFAPGVMEKWGLGYEDLLRIKPDIIMFRCSGQGQTGPHAKQPSYGFHLIGLSGFTHLTGWPDRTPSHTYVAYTDILAPRVGVAAVMAALDRRIRTGKGVCIDLSQFEVSAAYFLAPVLLDCAVNGRVAQRTGNSCESVAPHGVYPCRGEDRWCAIAVFTDGEWQALCRLMGDPSWAREPRFATLLGRKAHEAELNELIAGWTRNWTAESLMESLQAVGVGAGLAATAEDLCSDPQLRERRYFTSLKHSEIGQMSHPGQPFQMSETPFELRMPGPCLGEHTELVCREFLGLSDQEFDDLLVSGVLQ